MLALRGSDSFGHILGCRLKAIEDMGLPWGGEISGHGFGGSGGRDMLSEGR